LAIKPRAKAAEASSLCPDESGAAGGMATKCFHNCYPPPSALVAKNQNLKKKNPGRDGKPSEMNWIELEW